MSEIAARVRKDLAPGAPWPALALAVMLAGPAVASTAHAAEEGAYRVSGVRATATAKTAPAARSAAVTKGAAIALDRLFRRLTLAADRRALPRVTARRARQLVRGVEVEEERRSDATYDATIAYRFDPAAVRGLLRENRVRFVETMSRPVLLLAVWQTKSRPVLWDDPNPWRRAWSRLPPSDGLVPVRMGRGSIADLQAIDGAQAMAGAKPALNAIAARYRAGSVLIAVAHRQGRDLRITLRRYNPESGAFRPAEQSRAPASDEGMADAARRIVVSLERRWKQANLVDDTTTVTLRTIVPMSGLAEWGRLRRQLGRIRLVKSFSVVRFATDESVIDLVHAGSIEQLATALRESGLTLARQPDGGAWTLRLTPGPRTEPGKAQPSPPPTPTRPRPDRQN